VPRLSQEFRNDVERMGRWHIYGTRDELDPKGLQQSIDSESRLFLNPDDDSFGLGYQIDLSIKKGRRITTGGELDFTIMGPYSWDPGTFLFRPEEDWYPSPLDLIFEVDWVCPDEKVPSYGRIKTVVSIYRVQQVVDMFGDRDERVFWKMKCGELNFNRVRMTGALKRRWPESALTRRYQRA